MSKKWGVLISPTAFTRGSDAIRCCIQCWELEADQAVFSVMQSRRFWRFCPKAISRNAVLRRTPVIFEHAVITGFNIYARTNGNRRAFVRRYDCNSFPGTEIAR
jgi:hypothetical protein